MVQSIYIILIQKNTLWDKKNLIFFYKNKKLGVFKNLITLYKSHKSY